MQLYDVVCVYNYIYIIYIYISKYVHYNITTLYHYFGSLCHTKLWRFHAMTALCSKTRGVYSWNDRCGCQIPTGDGRTSNDMTTLLRELHLIRTPLAMSCLHVVTQCYKIILNCHELHPFGPWTNGTYRTVDVDPLVAFGLSGCPCF